MTFEFLFNTVFPLLGDFFGRLAAIANCNFMSLVRWAFPVDRSVNYVLRGVNVFTGADISMYRYAHLITHPTNSVIVAFFGNLANLLGISNMPLWGALLIIAAIFVIAVACLKALWSLIKSFLPF